MDFLHKMILRLLLISFLLLTAHSVSANHVTLVTSLSEPVNLNKVVEVLEDPSHKLSFDDFVSGDYGNKFSHISGAVFVGKSVTSRYWFRISLRFDLDRPVPGNEAILYIPLQAASLARMDYQVLTKNRSWKVESGYLADEGDEDFTEGFHRIRVPTNVGRVEIIGSIENTETATVASLPVQLLTENQFNNVVQNRNVILYCFYAFMLF